MPIATPAFKPSSPTSPLVEAPNVTFTLPEVTEMLPKWQLISDCLSGQDAIKHRADKYLPIPNPEDTSAANMARYENYLSRAVFYNVVANTVSGLVGQVFNTDPVSEYPDELEPLWYDASGTGLSLVQLAKKTMTTILSHGRCGLLADFPGGQVDEDGKPVPYTQEEVLDGVARPTIQFYGPTDIINWRYEMRGAISVLTLVVLVESYVIQDDGFEIVRGTECRVLRLKDGVYMVQTWRRTDDKQEGPYILIGETTPRNGQGQPFDHIPFQFVGAQNNDANVDKPPMYDMACLNIAHYRNSADYEDSVFTIGQPTPFFSGLTQDWVDKVLKGTVQLGSRAAVPLPPNGTMGLIQAEPNSMVKEAMDQKHQQMVALGAQLVEDKQVARTLGEAKMQHTVVVSTLTSAARNVSQAFESMLITAAEYLATEVDPETITFELSTDFAIQKMSPEERKTLIQEWQGGAITFSEMRNQLRQSGLASLDDEQALEEIEEEGRRAVELNLANGMDPTGAALQPEPTEEEP